MTEINAWDGRPCAFVAAATKAGHHGVRPPKLPLLLAEFPGKL